MKVYFWGFSFTLHWIHPVECDCVRSNLQMRKYSSGINAIFFFSLVVVEILHHFMRECICTLHASRRRSKGVSEKSAWVHHFWKKLTGLGPLDFVRTWGTWAFSGHDLPTVPSLHAWPTFPFSFSFNFRFSLLTRHWSKLFVAYSNFIPFFTYIFKVVTS